jgi:hypothetical protein
MSTGTGIFLSGLVIGLVMLYGQTKDRWNWKNIFKYLIFVILGLVFLFYQMISDWKMFQYDYSLKGMCVSLILFFSIMFISLIPMYVLSEFYLKFLDKSFQYDDEGNERLIYKITTWICGITILLLFTFYGDSWKEVINVWYDKNFN